jgi:hypothetical protein
MKTGTLVCLLACVCLALPALAQEPPKPETPPADQPPTAPPPVAPPPAAQPDKAALPPEPSAKEEEEGFKEEEPATPAGQLAKKEQEEKACPKADPGYDTKTDKTQHPTPQPATGKALVYVLRPTMLGNKIQTKLAVDGQWVGVNRGHNYFFLELDPGERYFCSKAENRSALVVQLEADKTYYLEQKIKMGIMKARNKLVLLGDQEGKKKLGECHLNTWQEKK